MSTTGGRKLKCRTLLLGVLLTGYLLLTLMDSTALEALQYNLVQVTQAPQDTTRGDTNSQTAKSDEPILVDYIADVSKSIGDQIIRMYDNVKFHHNGAIIECDSAYLYPDDRAEFFSSVIIQKDSAFIYGDRVLYDGNTNIADVFSPIVKMVQGDATMYSYNLQFNTKTAIGTFKGGGVLWSNENIMEAENGEFFANQNYVKFLDSVSMRNNTYMIKTDSLGFDLKQERLDFLTKTYIWDNERDFLMADNGNYFSTTKTYLFNKDAYIMTPDNEIWADTIRYLSGLKQAYMFNDIQILDTANQTIAFADWAFYDDSTDRAVLSKLPSVMSWDKQDTSYMRSDTMLLLTFEPGMSKLFTPDLISVASEIAQDSLNSSLPTVLDTTTLVRDSIMNLDSLWQIGDSTQLLQDSLAIIKEEISVDSFGNALPIVDSSTLVDSLKVAENEVAALESQELAIQSEDNEISEGVEQIKSTAQLRKEAAAERRAAKKEERRIAKERRDAERQERINRRLGVVVEADSMAMDSSLVLDSLAQDSLLNLELSLDSLTLDSLQLDSLRRDSLAQAGDTIAPQKERLFLGYNNVRLWAEQFQGKCDSMVFFSVDSTAVMFGAPVLWNEGNQITSEYIEVYTKNSELDWADFTGEPFIAQQLYLNDTLYFNQATGNRLETFFTNNELDYTYLSGSVQNLYYMTEQEEIQALVAINSSSLTIDFEQRKATRMQWGGSGKGPIYPIEQVPETQTRFLDGFTWQDSIRPKSSKEIMNRRVRESIRERVSNFDKPLFNINSVMLTLKDSLIQQGSWTDRNDVPTVTPQFFIDGQSDLLY